MNLSLLGFFAIAVPSVLVARAQIMYDKIFLSVIFLKMKAEGIDREIPSWNVGYMMINAIAQYRADNNMTQKQLGERIGCSQAAICKYERGRQVPPRIAIKIERETGISRSALRPDLWPDGLSAGPA